MGSMSQAKTLGGVGSLLVVLSVVPSAGPILGIVGFILVLIAVKYISDILGDKSIFKNMLTSVILVIIGLIVGLVVGIASFLSIFGFPRFDGIRFSPPAVPGGAWRDFLGPGFFPFLLAIFAGLAVIWAFAIVSAIYLRRSFNVMASRLNIGMLSTAALLYLIGAILVVVLVGFIVIFVAAILQTVAFFSLPEQAPQPSMSSTQPKI